MKKKSMVYGILCTDSSGVAGWLMDDKLNVATFSSVEETEKEIRRRKREL